LVWVRAGVCVGESPLGLADTHTGDRTQ